MLEILSYNFFQNALLIGLLASIAAGIVGSLIVLKKISFISGAVAHASFGGLGIAYFFGFNPILGATIFSVLSALGIGIVSKKSKSNEDALIGAMWAVGMSVGLIFVFLTPGYISDLFSYLFGNILLTTTGDIWLVATLDVIVLVSIVVFFRRFLAIIFDEEFCQVTNVKVLPIYLFLLSLIALTVVVLIKVVGIILVIALLTLPAATAQLLSKSLKGIIIWSVIISGFSTVAGLFLSYYLNWPTGPVIILLAALVYLAALIGHKLR
ncbi:metal ABC transporter permease [Patescibacteria group bacterium]|nr:metal ABC transporter permease [Patescibacteria group bacterium]